MEGGTKLSDGVSFFREGAGDLINKILEGAEGVSQATEEKM